MNPPLPIISNSVCNSSSALRFFPLPTVPPTSNKEDDGETGELIIGMAASFDVVGMVAADELREIEAEDAIRRLISRRVEDSI